MARVWITDGSVPVFSDTQQLEASHRGFLGLPVAYEGFVDPEVPRGSGTVRAELDDDALFVEAEWCVELTGGLEPGLLEDTSPLVVQGLIEGKWFNRLLGTREWQPASLGNNLLAAGPGIATTLGELENGAAVGEVRVKYTSVAGSLQVQESTLADLGGENVGALLREVLGLHRDLEAVDLGAFGERSAIVNEKRRLRASMLGGLPLPHRTKERLVRAALAERLHVPPTSVVTLAVRDGGGTVVGEGSLRLER